MTEWPGDGKGEKGKAVWSELDIPAAWEQSAAAILRHRWRKILVLGAIDRGKSTYCVFLSRYLLAAGHRIAFVDADIGQKDLGPPATVALGYAETPQALAAMTPAALYFVGSVTPAGHLLPMVVGTKLLVEAARAPFVIINTTGLVHGIGQVLKGYKIEAVQPDVIVALSQGNELHALTRAYSTYRIFHLAPSPRARAKTPEQRRAARELAFYRYFQAASDVVLPRRALLFQRTPAPVAPDKPLLCGVADRRNRCLGLALLQDWDVRHDTLTLRTPVAAERIRVVQYGDLYLTPEGHELGRR
ncbi:MAG: polyhydroxyalkanoate depolymerase [Candidatus Tectimicrobiota bacterium]|nr:MAG: polyhydroxyalkanoate depolymerase [Candidatus Tectomicrobia bacterium]